MNPDEQAITARLAPTPLALSGGSAEVPTHIMWMPAGVHQIAATQAGARVERTITVDAATARAAQASLEAHRATGHLPLIDFDHAHQAAAAWPMAYEWVPGLGVLVQVEWSEAGLAAIRGKTHRAFSPEFYADAQGRVTGTPKFQGGLVNDPAFAAIAPIWAQAAAPDFSPADAAKNQPPMNDTTQPAASTDAALTAAQADNAALRAKLDNANAALTAVRKEKADAAVRAAVARGAIPAKDEALQAKWRSLIEADESHAALLTALPAHPVAASAAGATGGPAIAVRDSIVTTLQAYQAKSDTERASIFARDIAPQLDKGLRLGPILAANSLGSSAGDLVTRRALGLLKQRFPLLSKISTDFREEPIAYGQTVRSRLRAIPTVSNYVPGTGYARSDAVTTDVPVTINQHKGVEISFNANELSSTNRDLFGEQAEAAHYALGKALVDAVYALIVIGTFTNATTKALGSFARGDVTAMAKALYNRGVPEMDRFLILNPDYFEKLGQDSALVNLAAYQRPEVITDWALPPVAGFNIIQAVNLPTTGNLTGFAGTPDSLVLATRLPNDYSTALPGTAGSGSVSTVTNEDTGIAVQLVQYVDHRLGEAAWRIALQYGAAAGQAASGQILKSA